MHFSKICLIGLFVGWFVLPSEAVILRFKYEKDKVESNEVTAIVQGEVKVEGTQPLEGTTKGQMGIRMTQKTTGVDEKGVATQEFRLEGLNLNLDSEVDLGKGKQPYQLKLDEKGGTYTAEGKESKIPPMEDVKSQSWQVRIDPMGAPVGFNLDSSQLGTEEAREVQNLSDSVANFVAKSAPLPEKEVEVGQAWENVLSIKDLTSSLAKDNPMLSAFTNLGIEDVKTVSTLKDLRTEGGQELATITSITQFAWKDGQIPLGVVNITVKNLELKSESLSEMNNTKGYLPRSSAITTIVFDITVDLPIGSEGPSNYTAKGNLKLESTTMVK
jgi:hypothetical protein